MVKGERKKKNKGTGKKIFFGKNKDTLWGDTGQMRVLKVIVTKIRNMSLQTQRCRFRKSYGRCFRIRVKHTVSGRVL